MNSSNRQSETERRDLRKAYELLSFTILISMYQTNLLEDPHEDNENLKIQREDLAEEIAKRIWFNTNGEMELFQKMNTKKLITEGKSEKIVFTHSASHRLKGKLDHYFRSRHTQLNVVVERVSKDVIDRYKNNSDQPTTVNKLEDCLHLPKNASSDLELAHEQAIHLSHANTALKWDSAEQTSWVKYRNATKSAYDVLTTKKYGKAPIDVISAKDSPVSQWFKKQWQKFSETFFSRDHEEEYRRGHSKFWKPAGYDLKVSLDKNQGYMPRKNKK